jgi:putative DNA primase/helicase
MTLEEFLARCNKPKRAGKGHAALCPAHDDDRHSLSIGEGNKGIVLKCHAGCTAEAVVAAMGLRMADLFPADTGKRSPFTTGPRKVVKTTNSKPKPVPKPLSDDEVVAEQRALRNDPDAWAYVTKTLGFTQDAIGRACLGLYNGHLSYPYMRDEEWTYRKLRSIRDKKKFFRYPEGQASHLYTGASDLTLVEGGSVAVFEGERDAVAAASLSLNVALVSIPDGVDSATKPSVIEPLKTQQRIYLALDSDEPGDAAAEKMADAAGREKCYRMRFPGYKDLGDLLAAEGVEQGRKLALEAFMAAVPMAAPVPTASATEEATEEPERTESPSPEAPGCPTNDDREGGRTLDTPPTSPDLLAGLTPSSSLSDVRRALEDLAAKTKMATVAERAIERERAVAAVKQVSAVSSAAKVVDAFLAVPEQPKDGVSLDDVEPAAEPQDTGTLLHDLAEMFQRYLVLPSGAAEVLAAWAMHTWVPETSHYTPRLVVTSPTKRCGKTLVLELLEATAARAILSASLTAAVLYRAIEAFRPTLLVDEADTFLSENEELRGVINAGYKASGTVLRCVGDEHEPQRFRCFAPIAIAAIGNVPATVVDRAFAIKMSRKGKGEKVERLDRQARASLATFPPRLARWAEDHRGALEELVVDAPESLNDRQREIAEPLLMVAELAGGEWPAKVRDAIITVCGASDDATDRRERLLAAVWALYTPDVEFLTTKVILERLLADDESEWREASNGKPLSPVWLGRWLKSFGLKTSQPRSAGQQRGYSRADLAPVVAKYLPDPTEPGEIPVSLVSAGPSIAKCQTKSLEDVTRATAAVDTGKDPKNANDSACDTGDTCKNPNPGKVKVNDVLRPEDVWSPEELEAAASVLEEEVA